MLDRLIDFLISIIDMFRFWFVVDHFERGIVLRFGRLQRVVEPGLHWRIPFGVDREITDVSVPCARDLSMQVLTLKCGTHVTVGPVITYRTNDVAKLLLEADNAEAALRDSARGTVREVLAGLTWDQLSNPETNVTELLTKAVRKAAWKWGVEVIQVTLADAAKVRVLRLITGE